MEYKKTKSRATMKGQKYEIRIAALLYLRCKNNPEISEFQLATNVEGAGALDDVIMRYRTTADRHTWHTCFLQLKQKERARLTISNLKSKANDFALSKYLQSFSTIKTEMMSVGDKTELFNGSLNESQFLIYTNARAEGEVSRHRERGSLGLTESLLKSDSNCAVILGFNGDADIIGDLEKMDDVGCDAREFLQRFKVFSGQPNESELEPLIKRELGLCRDVNETDIDMFYGAYEKLFEEWWDNGNHILTEKSNIYESAVGQLITNYVDNLSTQEKKRFCFDIQFGEDEQLLRQDHTSPVSLFHIVALDSSPRLSCTKVLQFLDEDNHIFYENQCLLREKSKILQAWSSGKQRDLVILSRTKNKCYELGREICDILDANSDKRVIVVSQKGDRFANCLKGINTKYKEVEDICRLSQLKMRSLDRVKDIKVDFQGYNVHLREILDKSNRSLQNIVLDDSLIDSLASNETFIIGEALPDDFGYYIPRTVVRPNLINPNIFLAGLKTVFTVSGVTKEELQLMMPPGERVHLASDIGEGCHFVLLDAKRPKADFERISETTPSVHWLHKYGAYMEWKGTKGSIDNLRPYMYQERSTGIVKTDSCFGVSQRTVLVVSEPGMGKTVLVSHIAKHTKHTMPFLWVICVKLADYIDLIETTAYDDIIEFLASVLGFDKEPFIKSLLTHVILETGNIVAFLDGWDEILPNIDDKGWSLLSNLLQTKVKKIWITSRSFLVTHLENRLSTLSVRLQPFSEDDQIDFLSKYWKEYCLFTNNEQLRDFAKNLLSELATSLLDVEKHFTGIPLQTMMLAEVCTDYVRNPSEFQLPEKLNLLNLFEKFVDKKFEIYIKKTSIIRDSDMLSTLKAKFEETHLNASLLYLFHPDVVNLLHSKDKIIETTNILITNLLLGKDKTGIIDGVVYSRPKFIHRCFAEFFAGKWFSKHFKENSNFIAKYLFSSKCQVIWKILNSLLSDDSVLHSAVINNDLGQVENLLKAGANVNSTDIGLRTPLHLAAGGNFEFAYEVSLFEGLSYVICLDGRFIGPKQRHMVRLLLDYGADVNKVDTVVKSTPLFYALQTATLEAAEILLSVKANADGISFNMEDSFPCMLMAVADNGFSNIMGVVVDRGLSSDHIRKHFLIQRSILAGHLEIVRLLVNDCEKIKSLGPTERSFIHQAAMHGQNDILEYLLTLLRESYGKYFCRELIGKKDVLGHTAMYYAAVNGWVSTLAICEKWGGNLILSRLEVAQIFNSSCLFGHLNVVQLMKDKFAKDPKFVKQCINLIHFNGNSNLVLAAFNGHTDVLSFLVANGTDMYMLIDYSTPVLFAAVMYASLPAVMALINSFGDDKDSVSKYINTPDSKGNTSLHVLGDITNIDKRNMSYISSQLLESKAREQADIAKVLICNGEDINATNVDGCTPLHLITMSIAKPPVVTVILESMRKDKEQSIAKYINTPDNSGITAMHIIATSRFLLDLPREVHEWCIDQRVKTAELFISKGGDVKSVDYRGLTPLHYISLDTSILEIAKMFVATFDDKDSLISYINTPDNSGMTAMHLIATSRFLLELPREVHEWCIDQRVKTAELFISKGGDVKSVDGLGRTPLHYIAIQAGILEIAKMFVATFEDKDSLVSYINTRDVAGKTAKDYAQKARSNQPFWLKKRQIAIAVWLDIILEKGV